MIALFTALIVPWFVDWTAYKRAFEREASRVVGQPVTVAGKANLRLLPLPGFTFTELSVGRYDDGTAMMTVDSFSLTAELLPFLRGEMRIVEMRLDSPQLTVRVNDNGTVDWTARTKPVVDPDNVNIERMQIDNATIHIDGLAGGRRIRGEQFSAVVSAQSIYGPWRIEAEGEVDGVPTAAQISTGRLQTDGSISVRSAIRRYGAPYRLYADGPISVENDVLRWAGRFEITPTEYEGAPQSLPIRAQGLFDATPETVQVSEYRLEIGDPVDPYTITGSGSASIRETVNFMMTADGRQIDLDRLDEAATDGEGGLDRRLSALQNIVDQIPIPRAEGEISFTLPAIVAGDTVMREVHAVVRPDFNGWRFDPVSAILPGDTIVTARGKLGVGGDFGFTGQMDLRSGQPTGFANWLSGRNNASLRRLRSAGFSAHVTITGTQATFEDLQLEMDDVALQGRLQRIPPVKGRGAIIADLSGREINIDDLRAIYALTQSEDDASLTNHDLDIQIKTGRLEWSGLVARDVEAHVRMEGGSISVDRLNADDFYGATIHSSGRLSDMLGRPSGNFGLTVKAQDGAQLTDLGVRLLGENRFLAAWQEDSEMTRNVDLELKLDAHPEGNMSRGQLSIAGEMGGTEIRIRDRFKGNPGSWRQADHDVSLRLEQTDPYLLARQMSLPVQPTEAGGPVVFNAELTGLGGRALSAYFSANAPGTDLTASGTVTLQDSASEFPARQPQSAFDLQVTLGSQNIDDWLVLSGFPLADTGQGVPLSLSLEAEKKGGEYHLRGIDGQYGGVGFGGDAVIDTGRPGRPRASGKVSLDELSLPAVAEMVLGGGTVKLFEQTGTAIPFGDPELGGFDIDLEVASDRAHLTDTHTAESFEAEITVLNHTLSARKFGFDWLDGHFSGNASLKNVSGNAFFSTQLRIAAIDIDRALKLFDNRRLITGNADLNAALDADGLDLPQLLSSLSGSGVVTGSDVRLHGITTAGFDRVLEETDSQEFEISPETVERVARASMLSASFAVPELTAPVSVTSGEVEMRNLALSDKDGEIVLSFTYSLDDGTAETVIAIAPEAGDEALTAARPEASFSWTGLPGSMDFSVDGTALESYLSLRAFEREQKRVAVMQSNVLERQRLRREVTTTLDRIAARDRRRAEDIRLLEELQRKLKQEKAEKTDFETGLAAPELEEPAQAVDTPTEEPSIKPQSRETPSVDPLDTERSDIGETVIEEDAPINLTPNVTPTRRPTFARTQPPRREQPPAPPQEIRPNTFIEALERLFGN